MGQEGPRRQAAGGRLLRRRDCTQPSLLMALEGSPGEDNRILPPIRLSSMRSSSFFFSGAVGLAGTGGSETSPWWELRPQDGPLEIISVGP